MATVKILSGLKKQDAFLFGGLLTTDTADGGQRIYTIKDAIQKVNKVSEDKKKVIFEIELRDGISFRGETTNSVFHEFAKYAGTSNNPNFIKEISPDKVKSGNLKGALFCVIVLVAIIYGCTSGEDKPPAAPKVATAEELQSYAAVYCRNIVESSLKAPKTAEFPWGLSAVFSDGAYVVNSYVDSQNSFGALIRTHYRCELEHSGTDPYAGWVIKDFKFNE